MGTDTKLYITMLGSSSISYGDSVINDEIIRSKKFWTTLNYLIINRSREISQQELVKLLYPGGDSENPGNALKTLIHRIRSALDTLDFDDSRNIIINVRGAYAWNNELDIEVDTDIFEQLCNKILTSQDITEDERLGHCLEALSLYKGDFIPKLAHEEWAVKKGSVLRAHFVEILHNAVKLLEGLGDYERIIGLCKQAVTIDPYYEYSYINIIHSLVKLSRNQEALREYNKVSRLFYRDFGISPSNSLKQIYREIAKTVRPIETDLSLIQEELREHTLPEGAFYCEYEMFKDIYRLEVRTSARNGEPIFLSLLTLETKAGLEPSVKTLNAYMDKLQDCVSISLRRGDIYTRYSISQFILMLPINTFESCTAIMERISKRFRRENPRAPFVTDFSVRAMDILLGSS